MSQSLQWYGGSHAELHQDSLLSDRRLGHMLQGLEVFSVQTSSTPPASQFKNSFLIFFVWMKSGIVSIGQENHSGYARLLRRLHQAKEYLNVLFAVATVLGISLNFVFLKLKVLLTNWLVEISFFRIWLKLVTWQTPFFTVAVLKDVSSRNLHFFLRIPKQMPSHFHVSWLYLTKRAPF